MQMHCKGRKSNFKNCKFQTVKSIKVQKTGYQFTNYLQDKNRTMKIQTNFKHSVNSHTQLVTMGSHNLQESYLNYGILKKFS